MIVIVCKYHYLRPANKHCSECGDPLCKYCGKEINGKVYCNDCAYDIRPKSYQFK